jgi:fructan beta-fructosidase
MSPADDDHANSRAWRPRFHFTTRRHWINDPNGLVWLDGEYHLFYQYNPHGDQWGHMSWGHAVSGDLLHWQELPVAIPEDDRVMIFSGSIVVDHDNTSGLGDGRNPLMVALYTGCRREPPERQAQELAYSLDRGRTWTKHPHNPVLDLGLKDFRDPKVFWHTPTRRWVMLTVIPAAREVAFFHSSNLIDWQPSSRFASPVAAEGIWECPDLIEMPLDGGVSVWVLKVDVFEGHPSSGSGARLFFGRFDGTTFTEHDGPSHPWADHGADFYAALSWNDVPPSPFDAGNRGSPSHGGDLRPTTHGGDVPSTARRLWIGWMNCHRYAKHLPTSPWRGAMSVPRELRAARDPFDEGRWRLLQQPVRELESLRGRAHHVARVDVDDARTPWLPVDFDARVIDLVFECRTGDAAECGVLLRHGLDAQGALHETRVGIDARRGTVFVDRSRAGFAPPGDAHFGKRREALLPSNVPDMYVSGTSVSGMKVSGAGAPGASTLNASTSTIRLRVLLDRCSVEVFAADGACVISEQILPPDTAVQALLYADGGCAAFVDVRCFELAACMHAAETSGRTSSALR